MMRTLPVLSIVRHIYSSVLNNIGVIFKISWAWVLLFIFFTLLAAWVAPEILLSRDELMDVSQDKIIKAGFIKFFLTIFQLFGLSSISVNWHRYILIDEIPSGSELIRFDHLVRRYFWNIFLIIIAMTIVIAMVSGLFLMSIQIFVKDLGSLGLALLLGVFIVLMVWGLIFINRLFLKLPAIALGVENFGLSDALGVTRGYSWPFLGVALCTEGLLIIPAIPIVLIIIMAGMSGATGVVVLLSGMALLIVYLVIASMIRVSMLTTLYGYLVEGRDV